MRAADNQSRNRGRDPDLPGRGDAGNPRRNVNRDARDVVAAPLDLAGVQARPDLETERPQATSDRERAVQRSARSIKCREDPVTRRLDQTTAETLDRAANDLVVA